MAQYNTQPIASIRLIIFTSPAQDMRVIIAKPIRIHVLAAFDRSTFVEAVTAYGVTSFMWCSS
jgi:hypothetical protein